jgi:phosphoribosyl-dephospho-CoA transferase
MNNDKVQSVSRDDLNLPKRKCFVCSNDAKICSSRRTHTISEMHECIENILIKDGNIL